MRKILYVSGTRADYGLMKNLLNRIKNHKDLDLIVAATGMHLMKQYGETVNDIIKDGFNVIKIDATFEDTLKNTSYPYFISNLIKGLTDKIQEIKPDMILVLGDRPEMLATAITGAYLSIPVAHIHGGDVSSTIDNPVRHAITKLANIHFPVTETSAKRIRDMNELEWRIFLSNSPSMESLSTMKFPSKEELCNKLGLDYKKNLFLIIQHPVTLEYKLAGAQMKETLEAVKQFDAQKIIIYPNSDAGSKDIIDVIESYRHLPDFKIFKSLLRDDFLSVIKYAELMIGNSSSGVIDTPFFKTPVINLGSRNKDRERGNNIIDIDYKKEEIVNAIYKIRTKEFQTKLKSCKSPYLGHGKDIVEVLASIKIDDNLLQKDN